MMESVRRAIAPYVAAGEPVSAGWVPVDVYSLDAPNACAVELANSELRSRLRVRVVDSPSAPAFKRVEGLAIGYELFGAHRDAELAAADSAAATATTSVANLLRAPSPSPPRLPPRSPSPSPAHPRPPSPPFASELATVERLRPRIERYLGGGVGITRVPGAVEAYALDFPPIPRHRDTGCSFYFAVPAPLRRRRIIRDAFAALGYVIHAHDLVRTVPTPLSYRALRDATNLADHGFEPNLTSMARFRVPLERWLRGYIDQAIAINIPSELFTRASAVAFAVGRPARFWCEHLTAIAHDMGTHILPASRVPRGRLATLGARMAAAHDRAIARRNPLARRAAVAELVLFYEEDIVRHCTELWHTVATPDEVTELFCRDDHWSQLVARLDARIERAGAA